ncbi:unnamed protein product, partial [Mesorhabditis belari]|uniref:Cysteine and histidine-rich domain-containing protein 1 n=1 Tax=Mesorhabditis belari TaxID=2138241 RepID=A0AAF3EG79_9BILA
MTIDEETLVQCYNKGCGIKFDPKANGSDSCIYHPGPPYFHDAYKIWNCCNKKSTDFGTWLSFKGCTKGPHNPEKPEDIVRIASVKEIRPEKEEEVIVWNGLNKPAERSRQAGNVILLGIETTSGARAAIERFQAQSGASSEEGKLQIGTPCQNSGCDKTFAGPDSELSECVYHPGVAIFHEGMKYWSCCQKKTSDFGAFLEQKGCEHGKHNWTKNEKVDKLREDWFSSNGSITVNVYCKGAMPENIRAETDGLNLRVVLVHGFGTKQSTLNYELFGEIIAAESLVRVGERKVELILKQKDVVSWPRLRYELQAKDEKEIDA